MGIVASLIVTVSSSATEFYQFDPKQVLFFSARGLFPVGPERVSGEYKLTFSVSRETLTAGLYPVTGAASPAASCWHLST